jgi:hypothetical protein
LNFIILIDLFLLQAISNLSDNTSPTCPDPFPISAFKILYLSPLKLKNAPGIGYKPFIFPIIFFASSFQLFFLQIYQFFLHMLLLNDLDQ